MATACGHAFDPRPELALERVVDVPPDRIWVARTQPKLLTEWFCPAPWKTVECEVDLRRGASSAR